MEYRSRNSRTFRYVSILYVNINIKQRRGAVIRKVIEEFDLIHKTNFIKSYKI